MRFAKLLPLLVLAACRSAPAPEPVRPAPPAASRPLPHP